MESDLEIDALQQRSAELKGVYYLIQGRKHEEKIRQLTDKMRLKTAKLEKQTVKEWREYYLYNRLTWDIERQARGEPEILVVDVVARSLLLHPPRRSCQNCSLLCVLFVISFSIFGVVLIKKPRVFGEYMGPAWTAGLFPASPPLPHSIHLLTDTKATESSDSISVSSLPPCVRDWYQALYGCRSIFLSPSFAVALAR